MNYRVAFLVVGGSLAATATIIGLIYGLGALLGEWVGGGLAFGLTVVAMFVLIAWATPK